MINLWFSAFPSEEARSNDSWHEEIAIQAVQGMHQLLPSMANTGIIFGAEVKFKY
jgi:hypothetical protein